MKPPCGALTPAITSLALALASCGSPEDTPTPTAPASPAVSPVPADPTPPEVALARSFNTFGLDLHRVLAAENPDANFLISPYALGSGLAMVSCGAEGETLAEFRRVLHLPEEKVMLRGMESLLGSLQPSPDQVKERMPHSDGSLSVSIASRLYGQTGFGYQPDFLGKLRNSFRSDLEAVDFAQNPESARETINSWVSGKTNGKIGSLLPAGAITDQTRFSLVAALHFADQWGYPFEPEDTKPAAFHLSGQKQVMVPTMFQREHLAFHVGDGFKAVEKWYLSQPDCRFLVLVPDAKNGLRKMEEKLSSSLFTDPKAFGNDGREVLFYLPKFSFEGSVQTLAQPLMKLGLRAPFDSSKPGTFPRISTERTPFFLQEVHQQANINIYEDGTEVFVGLGEGMGVGAGEMNPPPPLEIRADHPFLFAIQEMKTGALLFLGRVTDPR